MCKPSKSSFEEISTCDESNKPIPQICYAIRALKRIVIMELKISKETWDKIGPDEAKFIFSQGDKLLKETLQTSDAIVSRSTTLMTVIIGAMTTLIGFIATSISKGTFNELVLTSIIAVGYLYFVSYDLHKNLKSREYMYAGTLPGIFLNEEFYKESSDTTSREKSFHLTEALNYQDRIKTNIKVNNERFKLMDACMTRLFYFPGILGGVYSVFLILFWLKDSLCWCYR